MKIIFYVFLSLWHVISLSFAGNNRHDDFFKKASYVEKIKLGLITESSSDENEYSFVLTVPNHIYFSEPRGLAALSEEKYKSCMLNYFENEYYFQGKTETIFSKKEGELVLLYVIKNNIAYTINVSSRKGRFTIAEKNYYVDFKDNSLRINSYPNEKDVYDVLTVERNISLAYAQRLAIQSHYDAGFERIASEKLTNNDLVVYEHNSEICKSLFADKKDYIFKRMFSNLVTIARLKFDLGRF